MVQACEGVELDRKSLELALHLPYEKKDRTLLFLVEVEVVEVFPCPALFSVHIPMPRVLVDLVHILLHYWMNYGHCRVVHCGKLDDHSFGYDHDPSHSVVGFLWNACFAKHCI